MITREKFLDLVNQIEFGHNVHPKKSTKRLNLSDSAKWHKMSFPDNTIREIEHIPGMTSGANCFMVNEICKSLLPTQTYLNIGVYKGLTMVAGLHNTTCNVIGVDNFSEFDGPEQEFMSNYATYKRANSSFYNQDFRHYLKHTHKTPIDFYFYDGPHSYQDQYDAIDLVIPYLKKYSVVMIDDINFTQVIEGTIAAIKDHGVQYNTWFLKHTANNAHPSFWNGIWVMEIIK